MQRALGAPLTALVLFASVAGPLLDRAELAARTVLESAHDPASCAPAHDHRLCLQVGANHALLSPERVRAGSASVRVTALPEATGAQLASVLAVGHPTRAPPSA